MGSFPVFLATSLCLALVSIPATATDGAQEATVPQRGLTYGAGVKIPGRPISLWSCGLSADGQSQCDAVVGDRLCDAPAPVLCLRDIDAPSPDVATQAAWSGSVLAETSPVPGFEVSTEVQGDDLCRSVFGDLWRWATIQDGGTNEIQGYGVASPAGTRVWIRDRTQDGSVCGSPPSAPD